jgi:hypothetical protein
VYKFDCITLKKSIALIFFSFRLNIVKPWNWAKRPIAEERGIGKSCRKFYRHFKRKYVMKKNVIVLLLGVLSLGACRTIKNSDFHSDKPLTEKLPMVDLLVHERSFLAAFDEELLKDMHFTVSPLEPDPWAAHEVTDVALKDVFKLLDIELSENLNQNEGPYYGYARFKLNDYSRSNPGWGWLIPSMGTAFIANLVGMPCSNIKSKLELQMEIVDATGKILKQYTGTGSGKGVMALYYGYPLAYAVRKANLGALKEAMLEIKKKVSVDAGMLSENLKAGGELIHRVK